MEEIWRKRAASSKLPKPWQKKLRKLFFESLKRLPCDTLRFLGWKGIKNNSSLNRCRKIGFFSLTELFQFRRTGRQTDRHTNRHCVFPPSLHFIADWPSWALRVRSHHTKESKQNYFYRRWWGQANQPTPFPFSLPLIFPFSSWKRGVGGGAGDPIRQTWWWEWSWSLMSAAVASLSRRTATFFKTFLLRSFLVHC